MTDRSAEQWRRADEKVRHNLPPGVKLVRTLRGHTGWIGRIAWSPNGRMLASPSFDDTIRFWNSDSGQCVRIIDGQHGSISSIAFDARGGRILASAGWDKTVRIWDLVTGGMLQQLGEHSDLVTSLAFDPRGRTLASGSRDRRVFLWDANTGHFLRRIASHRKGVSCIAFDPQGHIVASGSDDGTIKLTDVDSGRLIRTLDGNIRIWSIAIDPQGRLLVSGSEDGTVKLWEIDKGRLLRTLEGHTRSVHSVAFLCDGTIVASKGGKGDDAIRLWSSETGACLAAIPESASDVWPPAFPSIRTFHSLPPSVRTLARGRMRSSISGNWILPSSSIKCQSQAPTMSTPR